LTDIDFRVIKQIPDGLSPVIQSAVHDFMDASGTEGINPDGFYSLTLESIANSTYLNGGGEFWVGTRAGELLIYILAVVSRDLDGKLCYCVNQAWVRKDYRGNPIVKQWWEQIRQRAKDLFCKHLMITSSRGHKAYERFLGHGMKHYADLLKETL